MSIVAARRQNLFELGRVQNFVAVGNGILLPADTNNSAVQFPELPEGSPATDVMIVNTGTVTAFITFGSESPTAVAPTDGNPANGIAIPGGVIMVLDKGFSTWVAGLTLTSNADVYLYQGIGS